MYPRSFKFNGTLALPFGANVCTLGTRTFKAMAPRVLGPKAHPWT